MSEQTQARQEEGPDPQSIPDEQVQGQTTIHQQIRPIDARRWSRNAPRGMTRPGDILDAQGIIGNRAVQRLLQAKAEELGAGSTSTAIQRTPDARSLAFSGHDRVRELRWPGQQILDQFGETEGGYFDPHGDMRVQGTVLRITFNPTIYLNEALQGADLDRERAHEQRHYDDFLELAQWLQEDLQIAVQGGLGDQEADDYWGWFIYDVCRRGANFHREILAPVAFCTQPSRPRPPRPEPAGGAEEEGGE